MKKLVKVICIVGMLISLAAIGSAATVSMQSKKLGLLRHFNEGTVTITYPVVGSINAYGGSVPLDILQKYGWGVQIDRGFLVKANVSGDVDKVEFTLLPRNGGKGVVLNDTEAPFEVTFSVKTGAYNITAQAFFQDVLVAEDSEGPIYYLRGLIKRPA